MLTCSHRQPSAPTPPFLPNEKCNLPRGGGGRVLQSFSCAYIGYLNNYYSAKLQFTTDFMSRLRLKMSDKQNVLCCPPRGVCLRVLHMQKKEKKSMNAGCDPLYLDLQFLLIVSSQPLWTWKHCCAQGSLIDLLGSSGMSCYMSPSWSLYAFLTPPTTPPGTLPWW